MNQSAARRASAMWRGPTSDFDFRLRPGANPLRCHRASITFNPHPHPGPRRELNMSANTTTTAAAEPPPKSKRRGTLLVVDDEEGPRQSLRVIFKDDYDLLMASDGAT